MELGADPDGLSHLAEDMERSAATIESAGRRLNGGLEAAAWRGPDARAFRAQWTTHTSELRRVGSALRRAAHDLHRHATQQRLASAGDARGPSDPLPLRVERWAGSFTANATVLAGAGAAVVIADLPGPRSLVSVSNEVEVGAAASGGTGVEVHDEGASAGVSAGGTVAAGVLVSGSQGWYVDDDRAAHFAADRVRDRAIDGAVDSVLPFDMAGVVRSTLGLSGPHPDVTTTLVGVTMSASALVDGTSGARVSAGAVAAATWQAGLRTRGSQKSLLISVNGSAAGRLAGSLLGLGAGIAHPLSAELDGAGAAEIEIFPATGGVRPVVLSGWASTGDTAAQARTTLLYDEKAVGDSLDRARDALERGDADGAVGELSALKDVVLLDSTDMALGTVSADTLGGSVSGGEGLGVGLAVEGTHSVATYEPAPVTFTR